MIYNELRQFCKMTHEQIKNNELDKLIRNALKSNDELVMPSSLSDKIVQKIEKKILLRELILELSFKVGLILGSLIMLAGVFVCINGSSVLVRLYDYFVNRWQIITSLLIIVLITILIDQIGLRFYYTVKKEVGN